MAVRSGRPVGVMGLSFAGGLALVAAEDPQYAPDFRFVFAVGAQDSMARVTQYYESGHDLRPDGTTEILPPHEYGPLVIEYQHLADFVPARDLARVRAAMRAHLYEDKAAESQAFGALSDTQQIEARSLLESSSPETKARIASARVKYAGEMQRLSPAGRLQTLRVPVYLLHGQGDNVIPAAETQWMAHDLPQSELRAALVTPVLSHVDVGGATAGDEWRLVHFFAQVLEAAERR